MRFSDTELRTLSPEQYVLVVYKISVMTTYTGRANSERRRIQIAPVPFVRTDYSCDYIAVLEFFRFLASE